MASLMFMYQLFSKCGLFMYYTVAHSFKKYDYLCTQKIFILVLIQLARQQAILYCKL